MATSVDITGIFAQLTEGYLKLPLVQKIVFPLLVVASVSGIIYVSKWANRPDYAVLYSDLEPADSAAVVQRLKEQKIKYEIRGDGRTIAISPPESIHELRIGLAGDGIPKGGTVGYELFDTSNLGTTTFVEKLKFQRALQGELERTISAIDGVMSSRVHIVQPEKSVFAKTGSAPTASVMLRLRPGTTLAEKQVVGIQNLIAGSVEGLKKEEVTIVDVYGNLLTPKGEKEEFGIEATRLEFQHDIERGYVDRIEAMLSKVLGPGKVIARVTADIDYSSSEKQQEEYDPSGQVIRSERTISEGAGSSQRGGVPGVVSNLNDNPDLVAAPDSTAEKTNRNEAVKNYEVSRAVTKSNSPRGKLTRLSAAVLVDGNYAAAPGAAPNAPKTFVPLDPETMTRIEGVVRSAIGYTSDRGDSVTVENVPFYTPDDNMLEQMEKQAKNDFIFKMISKTVPVLFIILFFFVIVRPLVKFLITPTDAEVDLSRLLPTGIKELEQELQTERSKAHLPTFEPPVDLEQLEQLIAENSQVVKENPRQAALLIRYWLNDGRL